MDSCKYVSIVYYKLATCVYVSLCVLVGVSVCVCVCVRLWMHVYVCAPTPASVTSRWHRELQPAQHGTEQEVGQRGINSQCANSSLCLLCMCVTGSGQVQIYYIISLREQYILTKCSECVCLYVCFSGFSQADLLEFDQKLCMSHKPWRNNRIIVIISLLKLNYMPLL